MRKQMHRRGSWWCLVCVSRDTRERSCQWNLLTAFWQPSESLSSESLSGPPHAETQSFLSVLWDQNFSDRLKQPRKNVRQHGLKREVAANFKHARSKRTFWPGRNGSGEAWRGEQKREGTGSSLYRGYRPFPLQRTPARPSTVLYVGAHLCTLFVWYVRGQRLDDV